MANRGKASRKDPDDDAYYGTDETPNLAAGVAITDAEVTVTGSDATAGAVTIDGLTLTALLSGGTHDDDAELTFRYDTDDGQQFDVTVRVPIRNSTS